MKPITPGSLVSSHPMMGQALAIAVFCPAAALLGEPTMLVIIRHVQAAELYRERILNSFAVVNTGVPLTMMERR